MPAEIPTELCIQYSLDKKDFSSDQQLKKRKKGKDTLETERTQPRQMPEAPFAANNPAIQCAVYQAQGR